MIPFAGRRGPGEKERSRPDSGGVGKALRLVRVLGNVRLVNFPSITVNCSSESGELCKRTEIGISV